MKLSKAIRVRHFSLLCLLALMATTLDVPRSLAQIVVADPDCKRTKTYNPFLPIQPIDAFPRCIQSAFCTTGNLYDIIVMDATSNWTCPTTYVDNTASTSRQTLFLYGTAVGVSSLYGKLVGAVTQRAYCTQPRPAPVVNDQRPFGGCDPPTSGGGCNSPIAIRVGGEEIINNISSSEDGVPFDLKGDGHPLWYAWQKHGDHQIGWLAIPDKDGGVPSGKYLIGNYTPNEDYPSPNRNNGWKVLSEYTEKDNGGCGGPNITPCDAAYSKLRVWVDMNHDGVAQPDELFTLPQVGITSIGTDYEETKIADEFGNWYRYKGQINPLGRPPGSRVNPVAYDVYLRSRQIIYSSTNSTATLASAASSSGASSTGNAAPGPINGLCCQTCGIAPK